MRIKLFLTAIVMAMTMVSFSGAADIRFVAEQKQISPTTGGFSLTFTAINDTAAPIPISSVTAFLLFTPEANNELNFVSASFPATPTWSPAVPDPDTLIDGSLNLSASTGGTPYQLAVGATTFMVLQLELFQPNPTQVKYDISYDLIEIGDPDGLPVDNVEGVNGFIAVPEPGSITAIGSIVGLLLMRRRRAA